MRYLITFSYDGSKFYGLQKQPNKETIQSNIESALEKINKKKVCLISTGRTDALVHAYKQYAHFDLDINIECIALKKALNSLTSKYIYVKDVKQVSGDFHARFDVLNKTYVYKINMGEYDPISCDYIYQYNKNLDITKMEEASKYLIGTHNFKSFTTAKDKRKSYERTIDNITFKKTNDLLEISFTGNGFLRYMVRNMVGILIEIGSLERNVDEIETILNSEDRKYAGITAQPCGLYLVDVKFKK